MLLFYSLALYLSLTSAASPPKTSDAPQPCTIHSPNTHAFFDLNTLHIQPPDETVAKPKGKNVRDHSWNATGWDMGYNFSMNFCGPVVEELKDVVGVDKSAWGNVSAFYKQDGKVYSIGQQNSQPVFRGRKLVLNYTDGSPCDADVAKRTHVVEDLGEREIIDDGDKRKKPATDDGDDDKDDKHPAKRPSSSAVRRKNTIISMLCDKDPLSPLLTLNFVSTSPDECTYVFEARSSTGCSGIEPAKQSLSPSGVFGVIVSIAVIVYVVGGCVYSRMVLQQRGWRQVPNYALWAGMFGFVRDLFIILTSSCARLMPSRRGYTRVNGGLGGTGSGRGRGAGRAAEAEENRLIDDLNEEWDE